MAGMVARVAPLSFEAWVYHHQIPEVTWAAQALATVMDAVEFVSGGLIPAQITRDQVTSLRSDNIVSADAKTFDDLGIHPVSVEAILPDYLWRFRPAGQYEAIKESASNLKHE